MVENRQLYIQASKRTFRLNDDEDFENRMSLKTNDIGLFEQTYTSRPEVRKINLFLALFRTKKVEVEKVSRSQISSF